MQKNECLQTFDYLVLKSLSCTTAWPAMMTQVSWFYASELIFRISQISRKVFLLNNKSSTFISCTHPWTSGLCLNFQPSSATLKVYLTLLNNRTVIYVLYYAMM